MPTIKFSVPLEPRPAPRAEGFGERHNPKWYRDWKLALGLIARRIMNGQPPLKGKIRFFAKVFRDLNPELKKFGDWDNHAKAICDALNGICFVDDRQIVEGHVYLFKGEPHIEIELEAIE